ncbi:MAG: DUF1549 domain-containing protein [Gemmataceae bacterium]
MLNGEGGRIAEESRVDYVQDRVETTATVWLGLTANCGRCHDQVRPLHAEGVLPALRLLEQRRRVRRRRSPQQHRRPHHRAADRRTDQEDRRPGREGHLRPKKN